MNYESNIYKYTRNDYDEGRFKFKYIICKLFIKWPMLINFGKTYSEIKICTLKKHKYKLQGLYNST